MAKFIVLTEAGPMNRRVAINIEMVEYILNRPNGAELVTSTNHTKYIVRESVDDIMRILNGPSATETSPTMEVKNDETKLETGA